MGRVEPYKLSPYYKFHHNFSACFSKLMFEVKNYKKCSKKWMKLWRSFFPPISASWYDQLNEGVNKLTRGKPFLWQNFFCGNVCVYHRCHLYFRFTRLTIYFLILKTSNMLQFLHFSFWAPTHFLEVICLRYSPDLPIYLSLYKFENSEHFFFEKLVLELVPDCVIMNLIHIVIWMVLNSWYPISQ